MRRPGCLSTLALAVLAGAGLSARQAAPAAPSPVEPRSAAQATTGQPQAEPVPDEAMLGVPVYPAAQFLFSHDAGLGQRFYLYGTNASFVDIVTYYRNILRERGDLVFDAPPVHMFEVGRFREETMAFPPSVTVKDYTSPSSPGFANPDPAGDPPHFRTVIQIVPVPSAQ